MLKPAICVFATSPVKSNFPCRSAAAKLLPASPGVGELAAGVSTPVPAVEVNPEMSLDPGLAAKTAPGLTTGAAAAIPKLTSSGFAAVSICGSVAGVRAPVTVLRLYTESVLLRTFATTTVELPGSIAMPNGDEPAAKGEVPSAVRAPDTAMEKPLTVPSVTLVTYRYLPVASTTATLGPFPTPEDGPATGVSEPLAAIEKTEIVLSKFGTNR